jgi:threonine aldolase
VNEQQLRRQCEIIFPGHRQGTPAEMFTAMASWCVSNKIDVDTYGDGAVVNDFEQKVAELLGFEAAVFCISGTMAQATALRLACEDRASRLVALHPTSHLLVHEGSNYQLLDHFTPLRVGHLHRPWTADDLRAIPDRLGAIAMEVPMRELGGQNPAWDELVAMKAHCRAHAIHLHMDGARLWEAQAGYQRTAREIATGFDSVYVSLYKGIGGMGGAMLLGSRAFVARARAWFTRQGGNVYQRLPYAVAAAMQFDARLAAMPAYFRRTEWLYELLTHFPQLQPNPARPQANMLHIHLPVSRERALEVRDKMAQQHRIWLFNHAAHGVLPDTSMFELYVGESLLNLPDQRVRAALGLLVTMLAG